MNNDKILQDLTGQHPEIKNIITKKELFWINPKYRPLSGFDKSSYLCPDRILDAENRLNRFASFIEKVFPETRETKGIIESPLIEAELLKNRLSKRFNCELKGRLFIKCDNNLPVSGSIKARGGIYEVLLHAEKLGLKNKIITEKDDYSVFAKEEFKTFFSQYTISVGSTGNLGLSIGIAGKKLGFKVKVHMSANAKYWKKDLLRKIGAEVIVHDSDYGKAVEQGRTEAVNDPLNHFIDDENSFDLFLGYATAALRLKAQLEEINIIPDEKNPLYVYLPCGVGGGPGGITFGLKNIFGQNVHPFFAEPVSSPSMLLGLISGLHENISVFDAGLDNLTEADGLAVGRPSGFAGRLLHDKISGIYTVEDNLLLKLIAEVYDKAGIFIEPSAAAGMPGPFRLLENESSFSELIKSENQVVSDKGIHIIWATGGSMIPDKEKMDYYKKGANLISKE
ncbi:MAG: D-serine ammonia-lyase [Thermodesulfobacteriota bacterium]